MRQKRKLHKKNVKGEKRTRLNGEFCHQQNFLTECKTEKIIQQLIRNEHFHVYIQYYPDDRYSRHKLDIRH